MEGKSISYFAALGRIRVYLENDDDIYKEEMLAYGGAAIGVVLIASSVNQLRKKSKYPSKKTTIIPSSIDPLKEYVSEEVLLMISTDSTWTELCDRASEFIVLYKEEMIEFLHAVAEVIAFQVSLNVEGKTITFGTPRIFRKKLHAVVEAVRVMRAAVQDKCSSALDDFDEIAADIQRTHDDEAYNMQLSALV